MVVFHRSLHVLFILVCLGFGFGARAARISAQGQMRRTIGNEVQRSSLFASSYINSDQPRNHHTNGFYEHEGRMTPVNPKASMNLTSDISKLAIVRRGQSFYIDTPALTQVVGHFRYIDAATETASDAWVTSDASATSHTRFHVSLPPNAPVGMYELAINDMKFGVVVLFNPWCESCDEYVLAPDEQQEYVLNQHGLIWQGNYKKNTAETWDFDQFRYLNLEVAIWLLRHLTLAQRMSVVEVSRELTYSVGQEVCYGKWEGDYKKGQPKGGYKCSNTWPFECTEPMEWTGSSDILEQVWARRSLGKKTAAQYCQCFVYSGITTTLGRALGIATRPVTNFESAHDANSDRAISKFYWESPDDMWESIDATEACPKWCEKGLKSWKEANGCPFGDVECRDIMREGIGFKDREKCQPCTKCLACPSSGDSIWDFHVWNEMFMRRPFIAGFDASGWQAVDSTPQEKSTGRYQMGPASIAAVRHNLETCYDSKFVTSETNADFLIYVLKGGATKEEALANDMANSNWILTEQRSPLFEGRRWVKNPLNGEFIGRETVTKKPGEIPKTCLTAKGTIKKGNCHKKLAIDLRAAYKEPSSSAGVDPSGYTPLACLTNSNSSNASSQAVVVPITRVNSAGEDHVMAAASSLLSKSSVAFVDRPEDEIVEWSSINALSSLHASASGHVEIDTSSFIINDLNEPWIQMGHAAQITVQAANMHPTLPRTLKLQIGAIAYNYRGDAFTYKETRSSKLVARVRVGTGDQMTLLRAAVMLPPGGTIQQYVTIIPAVNLAYNALQEVGIDTESCSSIVFTISGRVSETRQLIMQEVKIPFDGGRNA